MKKKLNPKLEKYLTRHLAEFSNNILQKKVSNSDASQKSIFSIIENQLNTSQQINQELSHFNDAEKSELKLYLKSLIKMIDIKLKVYFALYFIIPLIVWVINQNLNYSLLINYIIFNVSAISWMAGVLVIYFGRKKEDKLKLEYQVLLAHLEDKYYP